MYEVELKVPAKHARIRERLAALDAEHVADVTQIDTYFDAPHRDFAQTDEALRIRRETRDTASTAYVTYKGPLVEAGSKTREEIETTVEDGTVAKELLQRLGFQPAATVEKSRSVYRYAEYTIALDDVETLGTFVEVETESEVIEPAREGAQALLAELGLNPDEHVRQSYLELLLEGD